jgi:hypothetical protein
MSLVRNVLFAAALVIATPVFAGGRAPLETPVIARLAPADGQVASTDAVRTAIIAAGKAHGWRVANDEPGKLTLALTVRDKHHVTVAVTYDTQQAAIEYVSSDNLDYKVKRNGQRLIHSSYNRWIQLLVQGIDGATRQL